MQKPRSGKAVLKDMRSKFGLEAVAAKAAFDGSPESRATIEALIQRGKLSGETLESGTLALGAGVNTGNIQPGDKYSAIGSYQRTTQGLSSFLAKQDARMQKTAAGKVTATRKLEKGELTELLGSFRQEVAAFENKAKTGTYDALESRRLYERGEALSQQISELSPKDFDVQASRVASWSNTARSLGARAGKYLDSDQKKAMEEDKRRAKEAEAKAEAQRKAALPSVGDSFKSRVMHTVDKYKAGDASLKELLDLYDEGTSTKGKLSSGDLSGTLGRTVAPGEYSQKAQDKAYQDMKAGLSQITKALPDARNREQGVNGRTIASLVNEPQIVGAPAPADIKRLLKIQPQTRGGAANVFMRGMGKSVWDAIKDNQKNGQSALLPTLLQDSCEKPNKYSPAGIKIFLTIC
ncbi:MAG: hypothetical protein MZW92_31495 [Comamonadaceae bacterium]|nr:hypothetical protein [Comamonadaceae bacterium]